MSLRVISINFLFLLFFNTFSYGSFDPTETMISAFCHDLGPFTKVALRQSQNIKNIIIQIKEDTSCRNIYQSTQSYLDELSIYQADFFGSDEQSRLESESRLYEDAIESEKIDLISNYMADYKRLNPNATLDEINQEEFGYLPDSELLTSLNGQYAQLQISNISTKIRTGRFNSTRSRVSQLKTLRGLQHGIKGLYGSINSSSNCRHENSNLITQLGATILGTAGNIYGGAVGAALVAGGLVVTGAQEVLRDLKYNNKIENLENENLQVAMGCSLEGISRNYCQARDVQKMIRFTLKNSMVDTNECPDCGLVFDGIDILARKVFVYNKWINKILAGSVANNDAQAKERIKAFKLFNKLTFSVEEMNGAINQKSTVIRQIPGGDQDAIELQLVQLMQRLSRQAQNNVFICDGNTRSSCVAGPYRNFFARDSDCGPFVWFYSQGDKREAILVNEECSTYIRRVYGDTSWVTIAELTRIANELNIEAKSFVSLELQRVLEENPDRVMAEFSVIDPKFRTSPSDFFVYLKEYLKNLKTILNPLKHRFFLRLIGKTQQKLKEAVFIIDRECPNNTTIFCDLAADQITELGNLLSPKQQTFSIENALRTIVTQHLDLLVEEGRIPSKFITHLMKYSNQNSPQFIINNYFKIHELERDTSNAKVMTIGILRTLGDLFLKRYYDYIKKSAKELKKSPWRNDLRTVIATRCFQFLHLPDDKSGMFNKRRKKKLLKICKDTTYASSNRKKVPDLIFSEVSALNHSDRICVLYDFKRKLNLLKLITPRGERKKLFTPLGPNRH